MTDLILVGLGNPNKYRCTPHNIGKDLVETMGVCAGVTWENIGNSRTGSTIEIDDAKKRRKINFIISNGFMNESGRDLSVVLKKMPLEKIVVIHDDIDLAPGVVRFSVGASAGGHRGVQSLIDFFGTIDFTRLRIGVGRGNGNAINKFVLKPFKKEDFQIIKDALQEKIAETFSEHILCGVQRAMEKCNSKSH